MLWHRNVVSEIGVRRNSVVEDDIYCQNNNGQRTIEGTELLHMLCLPRCFLLNLLICDLGG